MSQSPASGSNGQPAEDRGPAGDLGEIWEALDALPRAAASADMAATTIDMAAVTVGRTSRGNPGATLAPGTPAARGWLLPAAAVVASLVAGIVAGRVTAPDPDVRILEYLPLVRHLGLLEEAGSVKFLQSLASRRNQQPLRMPPEMLREEQQEFDAAIIDLETDHALGNAAGSLLQERRMATAMMAGDERDAIERSAGVFQDLTTAQRRDLAAVAAVLADPKREELRAAARLWHLIIAASDPPDRKNIVELDADSRIEWLERRSRFRDWMGERRGSPLGPDGPPLPRGPGGAGAPGDGRPRWQGPRNEGDPLGGRTEGRGRGDGVPRGDRSGSRFEEPRPVPPRGEAPPPAPSSDG